MNAHTPPAGVRTTCPYCGVGCGIVATPDGFGGASIAGDAAHPANAGRLCSKGSALGETLGLDTRLLHPTIRDRRATWNEALDELAHGLAKTIEKHGPDSVAFYLSGQLLTEDYYVANKLMKGFIGSGNVDTNSRLCMSSSVAGHRRVFGSDTVPGAYEDLDEADLIVLVGSNAAWCHPILFQRMVKARETRGARIVAVDVRGTPTTESADVDLIIKSGADGALFSGLLVHLADSGRLDRGYIEASTSGFAEALDRARAIAPDVGAIASRVGLEPAAIAAFFEMWAATARVVTLYSQGVNQSAQGTDKVAAILNCHLATGRIGRVGTGPFSLTGQPNAMGGREVGGLANQLAAHMDFSPSDVDRVARFWGARNIARREGLKAVALFDAIARGTVKALWIMGTNPAVSLPRADDVRAALSRLDLLAVSDVVDATDTLAAAHILLPAMAWGEKNGTVTNSERRISRQRAFLEPAGEARPDWWAVCQVAKRLGFGAAFAFDGPAAIFREHAALSAFENNGARDFDIGSLALLSDGDYERLTPVQWPAPTDAPGGKSRMFADGRFFTPSGRAQFIAIARPAAPEITNVDYPFLLNTGRTRDQWHTMTRTGLSARLGAHQPDPFLEVNSCDAEALGLIDGGFAQVSTAQGKVVLRVAVAPGQLRGRLFAPIHWSDETAGKARVGALVHDVVDPFSGQPDSKATPARVAPANYAAHGFVLARRRLRLAGDTAWAWSAIERGYVAHVATNENFETLIDVVGATAPEADRIIYRDASRGVYRVAWISGARVAAVLFLGREDDVPVWSALAEAWRSDALDKTARTLLLAGRSAAADFDASPTICACFGVKSRAIESAIATGARTTQAIGAQLNAGTNCGSCLPELRKMIHAAAPG